MIDMFTIVGHWPRVKFMLPALLATLYIIVQAPLLKAPLLFDDLSVINKDPSILQVQTGETKYVNILSNLFSCPRPVRQLTHRIDAAIAGTNATVFPHAVNMALHLCVGLLFFFLLQRLNYGYQVAFFAFSFFIFHPVCIESVGVVSHRKELLSSFFTLVALHAMLAPSRHVAFLSVVALSLAVFSKETAVFAPLLYLVIMTPEILKENRCQNVNREIAIRFICFSLSAIVLCALAYVQIQYSMKASGGLPGLDPNRPGHLYIGAPWAFAISAALRAAPRYFALLLWPAGHTVDPVFSLSTPILSLQTFASATYDIVLVTIFILLIRKRSPLISPVLWIVVSLTPYLLPPLLKEGHVAVLADRYAYQAAMGFAWALAICINHHVLRVKSIGLSLAAPLAILAVFATCGHIQVKEYSSMESFWGRVVRLNPFSVTSRFNHALSLWSTSESNDDARREFEQTLALAPNFSAAICGYADFLLSIGEGDKALAMVEEAIGRMRQGPLLELLRKRAALLLALARFKDALAAFRAAEAMGVDAPAFQRGFAEACKRNLLWPEAIVRYRRAAKDPLYRKALERHRFLVENPPLAVDATFDILVLGDSVPHGAIIASAEGPGQSLVERIVSKDSSLRIMDASVPGLTAFELNRDFEAYLPSTNSPARICLIMAGHNDAFIGRSAEGILFELSGCVFKSRRAGMRPVVVGPIKVVSTMSRDRSRQEEVLSRLDTLLCEFCKSANVTFLSTRETIFQQAPPTGGWLDAKTGNHLSNDGMDALAQLAADVVQQENTLFTTQEHTP